jgi:hypothetical protein
VVGKHVKSPHAIDVRDRLARCEGSARCCIQRCAAMASPQFRQRFCTVLQLDEDVIHCDGGFLTRLAGVMPLRRPAQRRNRTHMQAIGWRAGHSLGDDYRVVYCFCAKLSRTYILRSAGEPLEIGYFPGCLDETRGVVERMQCARQPLLLFLRYGRPTAHSARSRAVHFRYNVCWGLSSSRPLSRNPSLKTLACDSSGQTGSANRPTGASKTW